MRYDSKSPVAPNAPKRTANFDAWLLDSSENKKPRHVLKVLVSFAGHSLFLAALVLIPLLYSNSLDLSEFQQTLLVAPPPPPPPPAPAPVVAPRHPVFHLKQSQLYAPRAIPKQIEEVRDQPPAPPDIASTQDGVPGGVPGGQLGGVLGGLLSSENQITPAPPPAKPEVHQEPYRVGGKVQRPQLIRQVEPVYPLLAKEAKVSGEVRIDCIIDEHGDVTQMKVVSGNALLISAALNAVAQWKYQPTLLNGQPVSVDMIVNVTFSLSG
jgi:protein TonB